MLCRGERKLLEAKLENYRGLVDGYQSQVADLKAQLAKLAVAKPLDIPDSDCFCIGPDRMLALVAGSNLTLVRGGLFDEDYWYPTHAWWLKLLPREATKIPGWVKDRLDCESWGWVMKGLVELDYGFNACALTVGQMFVDYLPNQPPSWMAHGWFMFVSELGLFSYERNGQIWKVKANAKYKEDEVYM